MARPKLHNRICNSPLTLPVVGLLTLLLWWWPEKADWGGLLLCLGTAYVLLETNNQYQLIRVRSSAVSALWLVTMMGMGMFHGYQPGLVAALCVAASHYMLFRCYQQLQPVSQVFHAFLLLGLAAVFVPQVLLLAPFYYLYLVSFLLSFTLRSFWAGVLGLMLPAGFGVCYCVLFDELPLLSGWWTDFISVQSLPAAYSALLSAPGLPLYALLAILCALWCSIIYLSGNYDNKIRTRMYLYICIIQSSLLMLLMLLQPQWTASLLPSFIVASIPLTAHYFALTRTWPSLIFFVLCAAGLGGLVWIT